MLRSRSRWLACAMAWVCGVFAASSLQAQETPPDLRARELKQGYREGRVIVRPRDPSPAAASALEAGERASRVRAIRSFPRLGGLRVLQTDSGESVTSLVKRLHATGRYQFVEPDFLKKSSVLPNDPRVNAGDQWGLNNLGLNSGIIGADIHAPQGWDLRHDAPDVIVAVIDTGIRATHEDIAENLWRNTAEIPANGIDDDANGYVDDINGINAIVAPNTTAGGTPTDDNGHGSHVSGIIGAVGNNNRGISGVAWKVKIMALKFLDSDGTGATSDAIECIDYAIARGAHIINASYGGVGARDYSQAELEAVRRARAAGIIFVAASGNDGLNLDTQAQYPASLPVDNIVAVGASTNRDEVSPISNYGSGMVELFAPGIDILSLGHTTNFSYVSLSGTSMAAPHVSGALALLKAQFPGDSYRALINRLLRGASPGPVIPSGFALKAQTGGRLDLSRALAETNPRPLNDDFASRITLSGTNLNARGSSQLATTETGEPLISATAQPTRSLWWRWTAPTTAQITVDTSGSVTTDGSPSDTLLGVYTGTALNNLIPAATNDDSVSGGKTSRVQFDAQAGVTYSILIATRDAAFVTFSLGSVPANDMFATPEILTGRSIRVSASNQNASREAGEPAILGFTGGRSLWYRWTAPSSRRFQISALTQAFDPILAVYSGSSLNQLSLIGENDDASPSSPDGTLTNALVTFDAIAGQTYSISVDALSAVTGQFVLTILDSDWQFTAGGEVNSPPAIAPDGTVYVGSSDYNLYALNRDGSMKWSFFTGYILDGNSVAIGNDGSVYFGSTDGYFYAVSNTGSFLWEYAADGSILGCPAIASDGSIYFRDSTGYLYALSSSGTLKWRRLIGGDTYSSPVIAPDGTIYVGAATNGLHAYTAAGFKLWNKPLDGYIYTSPAIDAAGNIYVGTLGGTAYSLTTTGTIRWQRNVSTGLTSSPALGNGVVYLGGYDHALHALNTSDGSVRWRCDLGDEVRASTPAIAADGSILLGCYDSLLYHVNTDGTVRRTYATGGWIRSSPVIGDGRVYFGSKDSKIYAIDFAQGAATTDWPMLQHNARRLGRKVAAATNPVISTLSLTPALGGRTLGSNISLTTTATGGTGLTYQWHRNGIAIFGATSSTYQKNNLQSTDAGIYTVIVRNAEGGLVTSEPRTIAPLLPAGQKFIGSATVAGDNIRHPSGNTYDQLLLTGSAVTFSADPGQVTRISYVNLADDIVQVEFSGSGSVTLVLDVTAGTTPQPPVNYNQPTVSYMKGHARVYLSGVGADSYLSIFTVGRNNAVNQALFKTGLTYNGSANLGLVAIDAITSGTATSFGGLFTGNAFFGDTTGLTGLYAPGVNFALPLRIGDINASDNASPVLITGTVDEGWILGGSLAQPDKRPLQILDLKKIVMKAGTNSHGVFLPAQNNACRVERLGVDVTAATVQNP